MRILVYPHDLGTGGSQMNAIELASAVTRLGHECLVFGRPGPLTARIGELGLEFIESPPPGRRPSLRVVRSLRRVIRERRIDVVHGYEWPPALEARLAVAGLPGVAAVATVMSMAVAPFIPRDMPLVVGTQQICAAEHVAGRPKVDLIEPPVDLQWLRGVDPARVAAFREQWSLDPGLLTVVAVSRLVPELKREGLLSAIAAVRAMDAEDPWQLVLVGDGPSRAELSEAAAKVNTDLGRTAVVLTGELADPRPAYAAADISLGMGGSAVRSLAYGAPLVVQGERGFFRTLTVESVGTFRWQGWYGLGQGQETGPERLAEELRPLLRDLGARRREGQLAARLAEDFSLERAATVQLGIYSDALSFRLPRWRTVVDGGSSVKGWGAHLVRRRLARLRGNEITDDFNAVDVQPAARAGQDGPGRSAEHDGSIVYLPGVGWDDTVGTDRQLATALAADRTVLWVDPPRSVLRRAGAGAARPTPRCSEPVPGVIRAEVPFPGGAFRPGMREAAARQWARVVRREVAEHGLRPQAVIASTRLPVLPALQGVAAKRVYFATDDFVEASTLWNADPMYLNEARERNLAHSDAVLAVSEALARHLQRGWAQPEVLSNAAAHVTTLRAPEPTLATRRSLDAWAEEASLPCAPMVPGSGAVYAAMPSPVAGVVGQFNSRTDLDYLWAVQRSGISLLLVGPAVFSDRAAAEEFRRLAAAPGVHWAGAVDREEVPAYLRAMDVGLTVYRQSMFNHRADPLKTREYLSAGLPVVSTGVGAGPRESTVRVSANPRAFAQEVREMAGAGLRRPTDATAETWSQRAEQLIGILGEVNGA